VDLPFKVRAELVHFDRTKQVAGNPNWLHSALSLIGDIAPTS
jgi:hypothetical protein